jgi:hypothetical protein
MWIMLLLFPASVFAMIVDSGEECAALWAVNQAHFFVTGQEASAMCAQTWEI